MPVPIVPPIAPAPKPAKVLRPALVFDNLSNNICCCSLGNSSHFLISLYVIGSPFLKSLPGFSIGLAG
jgi:hypothetical protein